MLNKISNKFETFLKFLEKPQYPDRLAMFRISIGIFSILKILLLGNNFISVYGQYGIVQWAITKSAIYSFLPHAGDFSFLDTENSEELILILRSVYIIFLFFFTFGFFTRISSICCCFLHLLFLHTGGGLTYGVDVFNQIAFFYCVFMPIGVCYSIDSILYKKKISPSVAAGISIRTLQIFLCLMYLSSGIEKAIGVQWWNGEAIWRTLMLPSFKHFDMSFLAYYPLITKFLGWSVLFLEMGYSVFIWIPKVRVVFLILISILHFNIGLFLGMWLFGIIMILFSLVAFGPDVYLDIKKSLNKLGLQKQL